MFAKNVDSSKKDDEKNKQIHIKFVCFSGDKLNYNFVVI